MNNPTATNYWYKYVAGDIDDYRIKCLIHDLDYEAFFIYMRLIDFSIKNNGLINLDTKKISIAFDMQSPKKYEKLEKIINYLIGIELINQESNIYTLPIVRERIGTNEDILLNSKSTTVDEKLAALIDEVNFELIAVNYLDELTSDEKIEKTIIQLAKRYPEREILKAVREFADDYSTDAINETIIEDKARYLYKSISNLLRTPIEDPNELFRTRFAELLVENNYFDSKEDGYKIFDYLAQRYEKKEILFFLDKFLENISLKNKEITNPSGYLLSTLERAIKAKLKKEEASNEQEKR